MVPVRLPTVESLTTAADLDQAAQLYRRVFGYSDAAYALNPRLLRALQANGGSVVGVRGPDGELVAFAYGFVGVDGGEIYHYSQAAVVDQRFQGRGLGRALKHGQRAVALAGGQSRMRWSYDPAVTRNAHFNLDVLGAVGRWFRPDLFGISGTDRVIVEWDLVAAEIPDAGSAAAATGEVAELTDPAGWFRPVPHDTGSWLPLPADIGAAAARLGQPELELRRELGAAFAGLLSTGHVATSCVRVSADVAAYRFDRSPS